MKIINVFNQEELDNIKNISDKDIIKINFDNVVINKSYKCIISANDCSIVTDCSPNGNHIYVGNCIINICYNKNNKNYMSYIDINEKNKSKMYIYTDEECEERVKYNSNNINTTLVSKTKILSCNYNEMSWQHFVDGVINRAI